MNALSIESILSISNFDEKYYESYCQYNNLKLKEHELRTLKSLVAIYPDIIYYNFYIGYEIPQLGKEFDLLKFTSEKVLNIELKSKATEEKIEKQLRNNLYYLEALGLETILITYNAETQSFYRLDVETKNIFVIDLETIKTIVATLGQRKDVVLDDWFQPTNYLVSPFNSTDKFLNNEYLLTPQQENILKSIHKKIKERLANIISISGGPGTGKSLLTYHLAKELISNYKVLIIHCGMLNEGHSKLNEDSQLTIIPARALSSTDISIYELIIIDEAQRLYENQATELVEKGKHGTFSVIFSFDPEQRVSFREINSESVNTIKDASEKEYSLSEKIRTNKELASFIKNLFDLSKRSPQMSYKNITVEFFNKPKEVNNFINKKVKEQWKYIQYTNSHYNSVNYDKYQGYRNERNTHKTIGQEFDKVIVVIDSSFYYDSYGHLISDEYTGGTGYRMNKMLYQNITRVRKELKIVVLRNRKVFEKIIDILKL